MIPIIPIDDNVTLNTNVCTQCLTIYNDINDFFIRLTQESTYTGTLAEMFGDIVA